MSTLVACRVVRPHPHTLACPKCSCEGHLRLVRLVDVAQRCPACGCAFRVVYRDTSFVAEVFDLEDADDRAAFVILSLRASAA